MDLASVILVSLAAVTGAAALAGAVVTIRSVLVDDPVPVRTRGLAR